jgi:hypothetical protein
VDSFNNPTHNVLAAAADGDEQVKTLLITISTWHCTGKGVVDGHQVDVQTLGNNQALWVMQSARVASG